MNTKTLLYLIVLFFASSIIHAKTQTHMNQKQKLIEQIKTHSALMYDSNTDSITFFKKPKTEDIVIGGLFSIVFWAATAGCVGYFYQQEPEYINTTDGVFCVITASLSCIIALLCSKWFVDSLIQTFFDIPCITIDDSKLSFIKNDAVSKEINWKDIKKIDISKMVDQAGNISCQNIALQLYDTSAYAIKRSDLPCALDTFHSLLEAYVEKHNPHCTLTEYNYQKAQKQYIVVLR